MQTLEQQILELFGHPDYCSSNVGCDNDHPEVLFFNFPISYGQTRIKKTNPHDDDITSIISAGRYTWFINYLDAVKIDSLIKEADTTLCLSSPIQYIRECKRWYLENKIQDN